MARIECSTHPTPPRLWVSVWCAGTSLLGASPVPIPACPAQSRGHCGCRPPAPLCRLCVSQGCCWQPAPNPAPPTPLPPLLSWAFPSSCRVWHRGFPVSCSTVCALTAGTRHRLAPGWVPAPLLLPSLVHRAAPGWEGRAAGTGGDPWGMGWGTSSNSSLPAAGPIPTGPVPTSPVPTSPLALPELRCCTACWGCGLVLWAECHRWMQHVVRLSSSQALGNKANKPEVLP